MEATIRIWEHEAICARYCWVSESLNPGPSMLWMTTHTTPSFSSTCDPSKNPRRSSMDRVLNGCGALDKFLEGGLRLDFNWSHRSSAKVIKTYIENVKIMNKIVRSIPIISNQKSPHPTIQVTKNSNLHIVHNLRYVLYLKSQDETIKQNYKIHLLSLDTSKSMESKEINQI